MLNKGMMSSLKQNWRTPKSLIEAIQSRFGVCFSLDACAENSAASKAPSYYSPSDDGLSLPWPGVVWCNPPYGKTISLWIEKAFNESRINADLVVCLLPARTDTAYFHTHCIKGNVFLLRGRVRFESEDVPIGSAPFPSMLVMFSRHIIHPTIQTITIGGP